MRLIFFAPLLIPFTASFSFADDADFDRVAKPVLDRFCYRCHGDRKPKAGINLKKFENAAALSRDPETWLKVVDMRFAIKRCLRKENRRLA